MLHSIRRLAVGVLVASLGLSGLSYAGTGAPNPVKALLHAATSSDVATTTPSPTETPDQAATPAPEATAAPLSTDDDTDDEAECPEGFTGNHGQFVSSSDDRREAAHSDCGKPEASLRSPKPDDGADDDGADDDESGDVEENDGHDGRDHDNHGRNGDHTAEHHGNGAGHGHHDAGDD